MSQEWGQQKIHIDSIKSRWIPLETNNFQIFLFNFGVRVRVSVCVRNCKLKWTEHNTIKICLETHEKLIFVRWSDTQLSVVAMLHFDSLRYSDGSNVFIIESFICCWPTTWVTNSSDRNWWMCCTPMRSANGKWNTIRSNSLNEFTCCVSFWHLHRSDSTNICVGNRNSTFNVCRKGNTFCWHTDARAHTLTHARKPTNAHYSKGNLFEMTENR